MSTQPSPTNRAETSTQSGQKLEGLLDIATGARPARALPVWERFLQIVIIRPDGVCSVSSETRGIFGDSGLLSVTFCYRRLQWVEKEKNFEHRENTGLARG
jgi:hypothetical protein